MAGSEGRLSLQNPTPALLWGLVGCMVVMWSVNPIAAKIALRHLPAPLLVSVRTTIAALIVLPWLFRARRVVHAGHWWKLALLGAGLQVGNQLIYVTSLSLTSVAHAAFIYSVVPVIILLLAASRGQEKITSKKLIGMSVCVAGAVWLAMDRSGGGNPSLQGDALLVVAGLLFAAFTVFGKQARQQYGAVVLNSLAYVSGAALLQPVIWIVYRDFSLLSVPSEAWWAVSYMAVFPSVFGYLIYYWALGHVPASRIAGVQYIQPLTATSLGWVLLGESVSLNLGLAGAVILAGVYLAERR
ncbi:MAG: DMT family transporter [Acidobacteria bacterium]|nr:DMT family transporter [Acidobacteriota bacterium]MDA1234223.1 DMT family transporter [Acidobacteriota bacterium]